MEDLQLLKDINGNEFLFRTLETNFISVLDAGYIINPEGNFINVKDSDDHGDIFSQYLTKYLNSDRQIQLCSIEAAIELAKVGHIAYYGIKTKDCASVYANKLGRGISQGCGVIIIPKTIEDLTLEQKDSLLKLLETNKSIFGTGEKLELEIHNKDGEDLDLKETKEILNKFVNDKNK